MIFPIPPRTHLDHFGKFQANQGELPMQVLREQVQRPATSSEHESEAGLANHVASYDALQVGD